MKKLTRILLSVASAVLLSIGFYEWGSGFVLFIGMIPLLLVEDDLYQHRKDNNPGSILVYASITFVLLTLLTVWWVKNSVFIALIASLFVNTAFQLVPFFLFHFIKRKAGPRLGYLSLIVLWVSFEYLFLNVQVNFPWCVFGNAFASDVKFIQWYDVTGTLGGSLWVLVMNVLLFKVFTGIRANRSFQANRSIISWSLAFLIVPVIISLIKYYTYEEDEHPYEFVVLQPNIDPWAKFVEMPQDEQTAFLLDEARSMVSRSTDYIVGPETFINNSVWHHNIYIHPEIEKLFDFVNEYPNVKFIVGAMTYKRYLPGDSVSSTAKRYGQSDIFYDSYNTALQLDSTGNIQMYHKSKLVTGAEWMPSFNKYKFIQKMAVDLGGITRSHGTQKERSVFVSPQDGLKVAPVICWESIFGEYVTGYIKNGASIIVIITNDGWWKDTPGHRQHNRYARLRAIENRRSVARSANTGISCLIDQRGNEIERIGWWQRSAIKGTLNANDKLTFYSKHGDYIARISAFLAVLLFLYSFVAGKTFRKGK